MKTLINSFLITLGLVALFALYCVGVAWSVERFGSVKTAVAHTFLCLWLWVYCDMGEEQNED